MIIKFFPFVQAMIEQEEEITIESNKLHFRRKFGPTIVEQTLLLDDDMVNKVENLFVEEKELIEMMDVIMVDGIVFNYANSSLMYKELSNLLTNKLEFKYNPRAFYREDVLFYLGDFEKFFAHHYYQDAKDFIKENNLVLINNNEVLINNETVKIELEKYQVKEFNTDNVLYQAVISTLVYNQYTF